MTPATLTRRAVFALTPALAAPAVRAQGLPAQPVRLIVPQSAGSGGDIMARLLAESMARDLGQPVVVDNRPGANGVTATLHAKQQPADGRTIMLAGVSMISFNPHLYRNLPYDPMRDFSYIAPVADTPYVLIASQRSGLTSVRDLIDRAKANPQRITFSSAGVGNGTHLSTEMTAARAGISLTHVPYNGSGPATTAVVSGEVDLMTSVLGPALPLLRGGQVRALAVIGRQRAEQFPDIPLLPEAGVDAPITPGWWAMVGPAGMPAPAVARLNQSIRTALGEAAIRQRLREMDIDALLGTAEEIRQHATMDSEVWGAFIRARGVSIE